MIVKEESVLKALKAMNTYNTSEHKFWTAAVTAIASALLNIADAIREDPRRQ